MQWVLGNWALLLAGGGMVAMHLFGHGRKDRGHASQPDSAKRAEAAGFEVAVSAKVGADG